MIAVVVTLGVMSVPSSTLGQLEECVDIQSSTSNTNHECLLIAPADNPELNFQATASSHMDEVCSDVAEDSQIETCGPVNLDPSKAIKTVWTRYCGPNCQAEAEFKTRGNIHNVIMRDGEVAINYRQHYSTSNTPTGGQCMDWFYQPPNKDFETLNGMHSWEQGHGCANLNANGWWGVGVTYH